MRSDAFRRAIAAFLLAGSPVGTAFAESGTGVAAYSEPRLAELASEARQTIAVIEWFYVQHRACPQPARPLELAELQIGLGDGFSVEAEGRFVEIRGISMMAGWRYYTSLRYPHKCTLWRKLGRDLALIWRRDGNLARWALGSGDGSGERSIKPRPWPP